MAIENSMLKTAGAEYDAVVAQMSALREDITKLAHRMQSMASTRGQALGQDVTDGMNEAANYLGRKGHAADVRLETAVATNPYLALGIAAGVGALIGAMARR